MSKDWIRSGPVPADHLMDIEVPLPAEWSWFLYFRINDNEMFSSLVDQTLQMRNQTVDSFQ